MTQLFIENIELVLPNDLSIVLIDENPIVTKKGDFTHDFTLSLLEAVNAKAFGFIQRVNKSFNAGFKKDAPASLIIDGVVRNGSVIILKNTDIDVTCQFVSGNSALNYEIKKDNRKIWKLDFGTAEEFDWLEAKATLNYNGYGWHNPDEFESRQINHVCTPILAGTTIINNYNIGMWDGSTFPINSIIGKRIMQPYLLYYIERLPALLGFELIHNVLLTNSRAKIMYLVNPVDSLEYSAALPDWTIAEFVENIESFFNVTFFVDKSKKTIKIENIPANIGNKKIVNITDVLDSYNRDLSTDSTPLNLDFPKVSYDLPNSNYFKYQFLTDEIISNCEIKEFANYNAIVANLGEANQLVIYRDLQTGNDYFLGSTVTGAKVSLYNKEGLFGVRLLLINKFKSSGDNDSNNLVLKIVPAAFTSSITTGQYISTGPPQDMPFKIQYPVSSNEYYKDVDQNFIQIVEEGNKDINRNSYMEVALYTGLIKAFFLADLPNFNATYPFSHIDTYPEFGGDGYQYTFYGFADWVTYYKTKATNTMRLTGNGGIIQDYNITPLIDSSKEYEFILIDSPEVNINNLFSINNKLFIPISLERERSSGSNKVVKGKFYAML